MKYQSLDQPAGADKSGGEVTKEISLQAMNRHQRVPTEERVTYDDEEEIDVFSIDSADARGSPSPIPQPRTAATGGHHRNESNTNVTITRRTPANVVGLSLIIISLCVLAATIRRSDFYGAAEG